MRIAVIGSGIAGLGAAHMLNQQHHVTLYEADDRAGGHANTVPVTLDGQTWPVDTGFLVLNERTYPRLLALFSELDIDLAASDMSFSASLRPSGVEWSGSNLNTVFAQRSNLFSPRFLRMLRDIVRFNRQATALVSNMDNGRSSAAQMPLGQWLEDNRYGTGFMHWYLLPMAAAIWSCPMATMREFPVGSFVRFFHNHGLLQVSNRPQWFTVAGGSARYVQKILGGLDEVRLSTPVTAVSRANFDTTGKVRVSSSEGTDSYDAVVLATHSPQALSLLADASATEREILSAIRYQPNRAILHTDSTLMPASRNAWSAWNYMAHQGAPGTDPMVDGELRVSLTYWLNRLQPLPFSSDVFVTLNPINEPDPDKTIRQIHYEHPVFDQRAIRAQRECAAIQGAAGVWYAGAWLGYGFHEDGLASGQEAARQVNAFFTRRQEIAAVNAA